MTTTEPTVSTALSDDTRARHHDWLVQMTSTPTVAGREDRVVAWVKSWASQREDVTLTSDAHGNLTLRRTEPFAPGEPVYVTAHLDHPGFAVDSIEDASTAVLAFRGGVMEDYFKGARVQIHPETGASRAATIVERVDPSDATEQELFKRYRVQLDDGLSTDGLTASDIATWLLPPSFIEDGLLSAPA